MKNPELNEEEFVMAMINKAAIELHQAKRVRVQAQRERKKPPSLYAKRKAMRQPTEEDWISGKVIAFRKPPDHDGNPPPHAA
jgi:hypothetical protein